MQAGERMCDEEQSRQVPGEQCVGRSGRSMTGEASGKTEDGLEGQSQDLRCCPVGH